MKEARYQRKKRELIELIGGSTYAYFLAKINCEYLHVNSNKEDRQYQAVLESLFHRVAKLERHHRGKGVAPEAVPYGEVDENEPQPTRA